MRARHADRRPQVSDERAVETSSRIGIARRYSARALSAECFGLRLVRATGSRGSARGRCRIVDLEPGRVDRVGLAGKPDLGGDRPTRASRSLPRAARGAPACSGRVVDPGDPFAAGNLQSGDAAAAKTEAGAPRDRHRRCPKQSLHARRGVVHDDDAPSAPRPGASGVLEPRRQSSSIASLPNATTIAESRTSPAVPTIVGAIHLEDVGWVADRDDPPLAQQQRTAKRC